MRFEPFDAQCGSIKQEHVEIRRGETIVMEDQTDDPMGAGQFQVWFGVEFGDVSIVVYPLMQLPHHLDVFLLLMSHHLQNEALAEERNHQVVIFSLDFIESISTSVRHETVTRITNHVSFLSEVFFIQTGMGENLEQVQLL